MKSVSTREKIFVGVFVLALAWGTWSYRHLLPGAAPSVARPMPTSPELPAADTLAGTENPERATTSVVSPEWGQDPFNRPWRRPGSKSSVVAGPVKKQALWLTAIVVRPTQRYAVINGKIVREGQEVAGRRVTRIEASRVLVDDNGVEVTLTL